MWLMIKDVCKISYIEDFSYLFILYSINCSFEMNKMKWMVSTIFSQTLQLKITYEEDSPHDNFTASQVATMKSSCNFPTTCQSPCILQCFKQLQYFKEVRSKEHRALRQCVSSLGFPHDPLPAKLTLQLSPDGLLEESWVEFLENFTHLT